MKPTLPLDNLRTLVNAPNGIDQLRVLVYELAFQGLLVEHGNEDSRALADLLLTIEDHPTSKNRSQFAEARPFHRIPKHWCWVNIGLIGDKLGQQKPTGDFTYIDVSSIDNRRGVISGDVSILPANRAPSRARKLVRHGSIIYSTVRPYLLNIAVVDKHFDPMPIASTAFAVLHPHAGIESRYVYHYLRSPSFVRYVESVQSGIAYPAISDRKFFAGSFPLPPLEEQKRIVAKVDELMRLCNRLEAQQQEREKLLPLLSRANQFRFVTEPTPSNLERFFCQRGVVTPEEFKKVIFALAFSGRLVAQLDGDTPATDVLRAIACVKEELRTSSAVKADKKSWSKTSSTPPYVLPSSWSWIRLQDVFEISRGGSPRPAGDPRYFGGSTPWITVGEITKDQNKFLTETETGLTEEGAKRSRFISPNDLLLTNSGATLGVPKISKIKACMNDGVAVLRRFHNVDINDYAYYYLMSQTGAFREVKQGMGQPNLNTPIIAGWFFPFPPPEEQVRIVGKIEQLLSILERLSRLHRETDHVAHAFAKAAVAALTSTEFTENERMKPPKTEVVTALKVGRKPKKPDAAPLATLLSEQKAEASAKSLWQLSGLEIDAFYRQLKTEMANGWIEEDKHKRAIQEVEAR